MEKNTGRERTYSPGEILVKVTDQRHRPFVSGSSSITAVDGSRKSCKTQTPSEEE